MVQQQFRTQSCDYLLCQIENQNEKALMAFRLLNEDNKDIIIGEIKKALREQKYEETVAADIPPKKSDLFVYCIKTMSYNLNRFFSSISYL